MNRSKLLAAACAQGFKGQTLDELKAWLKAENIELSGADGKAIDVDAVWATKATLRLVSDDDAQSIAEKEAELERKAAAREKREARNGVQSEVDRENKKGLGGGVFGRLASARKAYNARANRGESCFDDSDSAELWVAQRRLEVLGHSDYPQKKTDLEIAGKTMSTVSASGGSAFIAEDYVPDPIRLRETYGVAKQLATVEPMSSDVQTFPHDTGDVTVYYPGEGGTITASDTASAQVKLTARKMATITSVSSELFNDSAVSVADRLVMSANFAIEKKLDEDYFLGDGSATYGNAVGLKGIWSAMGTITNDYYGSLVAATGNLFSELVIGDFYKVKGRLPATWSGSAKWVCHKRLFYEVMCPLARSGAGYSMADMESGMGPRFLGDPVVFSQVLPRVEADSTPILYYGDLKAGSKIGEVRGSMRFAQSDQRYFELDVISFRVTTRNAINVSFGVGNYNSTEASRVAGPIVGLKLIT